MDTILDVKNLKVSFRTTGGTVKAVRDISLKLERGKTLAIVGESGSGKSVTSKAILGILAGNSIIENGKILYDGKDLLKISEEEFCDIRGNQISMIFQDPLSSLNPIVKIGRQITEAMLLKDKGNRRTAKKDYENMIGLIQQNATAALGEGERYKVQKQIESFNKFDTDAIHMESAYNAASAEAVDLAGDAEDFLFLAEKKQKLDVKGSVKTMVAHLKKMNDEFFGNGYGEKLKETERALEKSLDGFQPSKENLVPETICEAIRAAEKLAQEMSAQTKPDFFSIAYFKSVNPQTKLHEKPVEQFNAECKALLNDNFMGEFLQMTEKAVVHSAESSREKKRAVVELMKSARSFFENPAATQSEMRKKASELTKKVEDSIDRMEIIKDSSAYSFGNVINDTIDRYFTAVKRNPKEERRFARQTARREALIAKGKTVDWKVVPKNVYDLDELRGRIVGTLDEMAAHYEDVLAQPAADSRQRSEQTVAYLQKRGSQMVYNITRGMAKKKALELMEEVGIPEPRLRYEQYPFEFSGGMRQRIVIAIALAADPDILICDEPTTALDVTIQAQILELINKLKAERNLSVIFITHDLGVVANMADEIAVMYAGKIVEYGTADEIFYDPRHPYTWALLASMPDLDTTEKLDAIPGTPPNMIYPPEGDAFAARNKYAMQIDFEMQPPPFNVSPTHWAASWLLHPDAPKVDPPKIITDRIARMRKKAGGDEA